MRIAPHSDDTYMIAMNIILSNIRLQYVNEIASPQIHIHRCIYAMRCYAVLCGAMRCYAVLCDPCMEDITIHVEEGMPVSTNAHGFYEGLCGACADPICLFGFAPACCYEGSRCLAAGLTLRRLDHPNMAICSACEPEVSEAEIARAVESYRLDYAHDLAEKRDRFSEFL